MLGAVQRQVNESRSVGGISEGITGEKSRLHSLTPSANLSMSVIACLRQSPDSKRPSTGSTLLAVAEAAMRLPPLLTFTSLFLNRATGFVKVSPSVSQCSCARAIRLGTASQHQRLHDKPSRPHRRNANNAPPFAPTALRLRFYRPRFCLDKCFLIVTTCACISHVSDFQKSFQPSKRPEVVPCIEHAPVSHQAEFCS
jgi:hypothetical protein